MAKTACGNCGAILAEPYGLAPHERAPCPDCGALTRQVFVEATVAIAISTSLTVHADVLTVSNVASLLMQGVVLAGSKTSEGKLIEAVAFPWFDIIDLLKRDPQIAFQIPPEKWEEIVAGAYRKAGFEEVILTPRSGDCGRDAIATKWGLGSIRVIDQVKAYGPNHLVTADDVRALLGVLKADRASKGFLTTTSSFAPRLRDDILLAPYLGPSLELVDGTQLITRLAELAKGR
jgi:restriction system protein